LQAVLPCDEADRYLPARRQPSTKAPMEDLLKRACSAGLGVFLATQSPGDFDYK
jgi:DNA helicase HerA-like ATPase